MTLLRENSQSPAYYLNVVNGEKMFYHHLFLI